MLFAAADLVWCADERASRRQGQENLRRLSPEDQRSVIRAVRRGAAADDPRLKEETIAFARSVHVRSRCWWGTLFHASWLGLIAANALLRILAEEWQNAAKTLVAFDAFALMASLGPITRQRARESEQATVLRLRS